MSCTIPGCYCGETRREPVNDGFGNYSPDREPDNPTPPSERTYPPYVHPRDCPKCGTQPATLDRVEADRPGLGLLDVLPQLANPYKRFDSFVVLLVVAGFVALALFGCSKGTSNDPKSAACLGRKPIKVTIKNVRKKHMAGGYAIYEALAKTERGWTHQSFKALVIEGMEACILPGNNECYAHLVDCPEPKAGGNRG